MCFGKNKCQNNPEHCRYPSPNNFCGGFALNAVLSDLDELEGIDDPMKVYCQIQEYQKRNVREGICYDFLHTRITNGTFMSLPSGICDVFDGYDTGKSIVVYYTWAFATQELLSALIDEEKDRIGAERVLSVEDITKVPESAYTLVLVNGNHWITVKKMKDGFVCYDPGDGEQKEGATMNDAIMKREYDEVNGLYICIS